MTVERPGGTTFKGDPLTVVGAKLNVGEAAPDFELVGGDMAPVTLADSAGKVRLLNVVPSLDTSVCSAQSKRFNDELAAMGDKVVGYTISADLPFAQNRWCGANDADTVKTLSDHQSLGFGDAYGTHIKEWRMEQRSVFVVGADGKIKYAEYVDEIASHPDYEAALAAIKAAVDEA